MTCCHWAEACKRKKKKNCDNWTLLPLTMPGLSLSPLGVAVKPIIRVMNALTGARTHRTKKPLSLRGLIISQQLYRGIYASGRGGANGLMQSSDLLSTDITAAHWLSMRCQYGVWRKHLSWSDTACQLGLVFKGCGVSKSRWGPRWSQN